MELREQIIETTIDEFNEKGLKFTMDDIAKKLRISKKTIYRHFPDKETLFLETAKHGFGMVKASEREIFKQKDIDIVERIRQVLIVLPERYKNMDWRKIYLLKETYPRIYQEIQAKIESDWEDTLNLINEGIACGRIKNINLSVFKLMVEAIIERYISNDKLIADDITYEEAMEQMRDILMDGICAS